jgi:hypothetical protein
MERREIMTQKEKDIEYILDGLEKLGIRTHEQFEEFMKLVRAFDPDDLNNEQRLALEREKVAAIAKMANA